METPLKPLEPENKNNMENKFKSTEIFNFLIDEKKFILKLSYNNEILSFEILEENELSLKEFSLYRNYEQLRQIDKYFLLFENIEEIFNSIKRLISDNNLTLVKGENEIKIEIKNTLTNKNFFINIPKKEKNVNNKLEVLFNCIISLNKKVTNLESENNNLKQNIKEIEKNFNEKIEILQNQINNLKKNNENIGNNVSQSKIFKNSSIIKSDEDDLILSWLDKKPKNVELLLDSKIDGDLNSKFYEKCQKKSPTMVFVKTTENLRFGGYTSVNWPENNYNKDSKSFLFSLDKKQKYKIKQKEKAIYYSKDFCFSFGGGCDLYIKNKCTSKNDNQVGNASYDLPSEYELNNGKKNFKVLSYEIYHIQY